METEVQEVSARSGFAFGQKIQTGRRVCTTVCHVAQVPPLLNPYPVIPVANRRRGPRQAVIMQHSPTNQPASTRCGHASCGSPSHSRITYICHMSSHAL